MAEILFKLTVFEGPMNLLLHLITKHKLNIHDIPIITLLEQYLNYMDQMAEMDMEITGEFLEMAARLIYIKTISLLPVPEEAEEMKQELQGRLIEYSLCKQAASLLREQYQGSAVFVRKPMKLEIDNTYALIHDSQELLDSYQKIMVKEKERRPVEPAAFSKLVSKKFVSVTTKILFVLRKLYTANQIAMASLFEGMQDRSERVATFLAILELTRSGRIIFNEDNTQIFFNQYKGASSPSHEIVSEGGK